MKTNNGQGEILKKSAYLMAKRGYDGTSMRDLAQATDRSLAGLYHYFRSKEEVLYAINFEGFSTLRKSAEAISASRMTPREKLRAFITAHVRYFTAHMDEMRVMMLGTHQMDSAKGRMIKNLKTQYADAGRGIVGEFLRKESRRRPGEKEIARSTYLLFGMMNWIFGWYSPRKHGSEAELIGEIYGIFVSGVAGKSARGQGEGRENGSRFDRQAL